MRGSRTFLLLGLVLMLAGWAFARDNRPIDPDAVPGARRLLENLRSISHQGIMIGHEDDLAYGVNWWEETGRSDFRETGGDFPAVFGWDAGKVGEPANIDGVSFEKMREWVPVVFRPWHEHNGNWFWWGRAHCTVEEYVGLWRFTVTYLKDHRRVHHLLYAYSPDAFNSREDYLERWPGDDWVDILGLDDYRGVASSAPEVRRPFLDRLRTLVLLANEKNKPAALTETGLERIPVPLWFTGTLLSALEEALPEGGLAWVLLWRNAYSAHKPEHFYGPHPRHAAAEDFRRFKESPRTLFLRDLPDLYSPKP